MGIHGLTKLLGDNAPKCIKEQNFNNYFGRKIAVDASMHIYQFLAVVGRQGDQLLSNEAGEVTSHLQGMFYRTARMLEAGEQHRILCRSQSMLLGLAAERAMDRVPSCMPTHVQSFTAVASAADQQLSCLGLMYHGHQRSVCII